MIYGLLDGWQLADGEIGAPLGVMDPLGVLDQSGSKPVKVGRGWGRWASGFEFWVSTSAKSGQIRANPGRKKFFWRPLHSNSLPSAAPPSPEQRRTAGASDQFRV